MQWNQPELVDEDRTQWDRIIKSADIPSSDPAAVHYGLPKLR
jgi:hypothetical protein